MPLASPGIDRLRDGFLPLFDFSNPAISNTYSANVWANAYFKYAQSGNVTPQPIKESILANDLVSAFNPQLGVAPPGGGRALFLSALAKFWIGVPSTVPPGNVLIFVPLGSIDTNTPNGATAKQQAKALADLMHQLTINSAKVIPSPPGPIVPVS